MRRSVPVISSVYSSTRVPGGSAVSRATIEVDVVGLNPEKGYSLLLIIDRTKVRGRELSKFDANQRAKKS